MQLIQTEAHMTQSGEWTKTDRIIAKHEGDVDAAGRELADRCYELELENKRLALSISDGSNALVKAERAYADRLREHDENLDRVRRESEDHRRAYNEMADAFLAQRKYAVAIADQLRTYDPGNPLLPENGGKA